MITCLLLASLLGAAPEVSVAVVVGRRVGTSQAKGAALAAQLEGALNDSAIVPLSSTQAQKKLKPLGVTDTAVCAGKTPCLLQLGNQLGVKTLVVVSVAELKPDLSVTLEAFDVALGTRIAQASVIVPVKQANLAAELKPFAEEVAGLLKPAATEPPPAEVKPPPEEAPPKLSPVARVEAPPPVPPLVVAEPPSRTPQWIALGGAVVAGGAAIGLGAHGGLLGSSLGRGESRPDGRLASPLTQREALQARDSANLEVGLAIGAGVIAVGLGVLSGALWNSGQATQ